MNIDVETLDTTRSRVSELNQGSMKKGLRRRVFDSQRVIVEKQVISNKNRHDASPQSSQRKAKEQE
jgi:hypothetical protein